MQLTKMRSCRAYSNLSKLEKLIWNEYQIVRADWKRLGDILHDMKKPKPRFRYDQDENRYRPVTKVTRYDEVYKEYTKRGFRLLELALYLYKFGYIAPDFTKEDLDRERL